MIHTALMLMSLLSYYIYLPEEFFVKQGGTLSSEYPRYATTVSEIENMLHDPKVPLNKAVIDKVMTALKCANHYHLDTNHILTVIDYSLPSNEKRLWIFDLSKKQLLFHTYVSHGIKSGALYTSNFSNQYNSKASSIGIYKTEQSYVGREGLSLRLNGLDYSFNHNAANRYIVMHGGWYMDEQFIKKYGRPGRSWGCPAVPLALYQPIINTIKEHSLFVAYYPDDAWMTRSKYLHCGMPQKEPQIKASAPSPHVENLREPVLYAFGSKSTKTIEEPVLAMSADRYEQVFHKQAPLDRMIRRQINHIEYIAISVLELQQLIRQADQAALSSVDIVAPYIIMVRGYYETQMKVLPLGTVKNISLNPQEQGTVYFESGASLNFRSTNQFIRWVGL